MPLPGVWGELPRTHLPRRRVNVWVIVPICTENVLGFSARLHDGASEVRFELPVRS
jgi:hypothetical protein